jgi:hypothetical protein
MSVVATVLGGLLRRARVPVRVERLQRLENRPPLVPVLQLTVFSPNKSRLVLMSRDDATVRAAG